MNGPTDLMFLGEDPRPDLPDDSHRWTTLFWLVPNRFDRERAEPLSIILWQLRAWGMELRRDGRGLKLVPLFGDGGALRDMDEFNEFKDKYIKPYTDDIVRLLAELQTMTD